MKTERYNIGPFRFTFRAGRVWWRYSTKHFGTHITASNSTSHSLGEKLHAFLQGPCEWSKTGLADFAGYFMSDIPGAAHWAAHHTVTYAFHPAKLEQ